jgi:hypothetical protein
MRSREEGAWAPGSMSHFSASAPAVTFVTKVNRNLTDVLAVKKGSNGWSFFDTNFDTLTHTPT